MYVSGLDKNKHVSVDSHLKRHT